MFQTACELLLRHRVVLPIETIVRFESGKRSYGVGVGILVNRDGWILTAGHILQEIIEVEKAIKEFNIHRKRAEEIKSASNLSQKERQKQLRALGKINPNSPTHKAFRVGQQDHKGSEGDLRIFPDADLGLLKVDNFTVPDGYAQPYFRKEPLRIGETVCRIGFPFYELDVGWDEKNETFFSIKEQIPPFANEGIVSRFMVEPKISKNLPIPFVETSAPGLLGQSGGPLFDTEGRIRGLQSHTASYPLGFSAEEKGRIEHQFLNVGRATQVKEICKFLDDFQISYAAQ